MSTVLDSTSPPFVNTIYDRRGFRVTEKFYEIQGCAQLMKKSDEYELNNWITQRSFKNNDRQMTKSLFSLKLIFVVNVLRCHDSSTLSCA